MTNVAIALDGPSARVRSNWTVAQNSAAGPKIGSAGAYRDELVKDGGQWLFNYRKIDRFIAPRALPKTSDPKRGFRPFARVGRRGPNLALAISDGGELIGSSATLMVGRPRY